MSIFLPSVNAVAQIPVVKSFPFVETLCVEQPPKIDDLRQGKGAPVTAQSKATVRLRTFPVAPDGVSGASREPTKVETIEFDFPLINTIGVRALGTTSQFLSDAILPRQGEPMRIGGLRRVAIPCRRQLFDIEVLAVTAGGVSSFRRAERSNDWRPCWTNSELKAESMQGRSGAQVPAYTYRRLRNDLIALAERNSGLAQAIDYWRSVRECPLALLRIARDVSGPSPGIRPAILITGATHGNEYLGIELKLGEHFLEHRDQLPGLTAYLAAGGVVYLAPVVNPDGFDAEARVNAASQIVGRTDQIALDMNSLPAESLGNLNRDFAAFRLNQRRFTNPESAGLASYIDNDLRLNRLRLEFSLDYHCCAVGLITPWTYNDTEELKREDRPDFDLIKACATRHFVGPRFNASDGEPRLSPFRAGTLRYVTKEKKDAPGSSIDYYYARYRTRAVAIEGGVSNPQRGAQGELPKLQQHLDFLNEVLQYISDRRFDTQR